MGLYMLGKCIEIHHAFGNNLIRVFSFLLPQTLAHFQIYRHKPRHARDV